MEQPQTQPKFLRYLLISSISCLTVGILIGVLYTYSHDIVIDNKKYLCNALYVYEWNWSNAELPFNDQNKKLFDIDNFAWANDISQSNNCQSIVESELNGVWKSR